jgi:hypothetical protein
MDEHDEGEGSRPGSTVGGFDAGPFVLQVQVGARWSGCRESAMQVKRC